MNQQLHAEALHHLLQCENIQLLSASDLLHAFREDEDIATFCPDGIYQIDPRTGDRILFNSSRSRRPHDNRPAASQHSLSAEPCAVCQGNTTGIIDVASLSEGFTFINKNLYPMLYPHEPLTFQDLPEVGSESVSVQARPAYGLHFLQWTSSLHDMDWHNMPLQDCVVVMKRLAALELRLSDLITEIAPDTSVNAAYVSIIKNHGRLVGGSLAHGHQQIALGSVLPGRVQNNWRFEKTYGESFAAYLLRENPREFVIRDYGPAVLLVPYFMRRPYDMILLLKATDRRHLFELNEEDVLAVTQGWCDAISAIHRIMPLVGRELAYNVIVHNGPGAGLYFEFLPYTQETGGFEHLGLYVCQGNPDKAATQLRRILSSERKDPLF